MQAINNNNPILGSSTHLNPKSGARVSDQDTRICFHQDQRISFQYFRWPVLKWQLQQQDVLLVGCKQSGTVP